MEKAGKKKVIASVLIFAFCCGTGYSDSFAFWENNLTYEGESVYNYLQVYENDERVALSTNVLFGVQSVYMKQDELTGMIMRWRRRLCSKTSRQIRWMC